MELDETPVKDYQSTMQSNYDNLKTLNNEKQSKQYVEEYGQNYKELENKYKNLENNFNNILREKQELKKTLVDQIILNQKLQETNDHNSKLIKPLVETLEEKNNEIQDLKQKNTELGSETGTATDVRLPDNDENNSIILKKYILHLQDSLDDYTKCKDNVEINIPEVQKLLKKYGSKSIITKAKDQNPLIKAVLQRHVIELVFEYAEEYFGNPGKYHNQWHGIETNLYNSAKELIDLTNLFAERRNGIDDTTKSLSIKLRQQIFTALGNRGFNDIIDKEKRFPHEFISDYQSRLNKEIDKYRRLKDPKRRQEIAGMAGGIIQKAITLFFFQLRAQEPIAEIIWFNNNDKIDLSYMEGRWEIDKIDNMVVDICYFPLIAQESKDKSKCHIYTYAKIFQKSKQSSSEDFLNVSIQNFNDDEIAENSPRLNIDLNSQIQPNYNPSNDPQKFKDFIEKIKQEIEQKDSYIKLLEEKNENLRNSEARHKENYEKNINNLERHITEQKESFEQTKEQYNKIIDSLQQKLNEKGDGFRELEEKNAKLKEEASKYQSALDIANIRLGDEDRNHSIKLKQDILNLQIALENYVTNLKPNMDINIKQVQILARKYGCLNEITAENLNKPFIKALLQRKVLDDLFELTHELSEFKDEKLSLEWEIESKAKYLIELIKNFSATRAGTDEIVNIAAIKIRQQVFGILCNHGFTDIIYPDGNRVHDFISSVSDKLNNMMNQYRTIKDVNRKKEVEAMAPKLIQDIYKLFYYRLYVQEPIPQIYFLGKEKNRQIDPNIMKGRWDDDDIDQLCVDICYFPLIGQDLVSSNRKIHTHAKVFPRYIRSSSSISAGISKLFGI